MKKQKLYNHLRRFFLNYNTHISQNQQDYNSTCLWGANKQFTRFGPFINQIHNVTGFTNILVFLSKLLQNGGKLLIVSCAENPFHISGWGTREFTQTQALLLELGWVNGTLSNWKQLSLVAWNSHKLKSLFRQKPHFGRWILEAECTFRGLHLNNDLRAQRTNFQPHSPKTSSLSALTKKYNKNAVVNHKQHLAQGVNANKKTVINLAYKEKPDCIYLINPSPSLINECKKLNVPLCISSNGVFAKAFTNRFDEHGESCYLSYLTLYTLHGITIILNKHLLQNQLHHKT